ncbi:MAG TPA: 5-demethoxyubiquinol-8 5-hydroxylase UbiM [Candidatus Pelagibacter bacterium]|jgi:ubiquinone biosynthesis UbiH/UbiF/VisC/COQ6 family hydroxylase|nr:5-demethoxyubiquinol-8 5-hydroxylase UbiM [Candidatus Pelagibacter bacterium]
MIYDIAIIGSGPNGDALACALADTNLKIVIIDKQPLKTLENPKIDGRDIALTHRSINVLKEIGFWDLIPNNLISKINKAKIFDGDSAYSLNFENKNINKDHLGCLIPNFLIKKTLKKLLKKRKNIFSIESEIIDFYNEGDFNSILLSNKKKIKVSLIIGADTRFSYSRSKMGISSFVKDFKKNMIVCRMKIENNHNNTAYEFFKYNKTLALLPYVNNEASIIITDTKKNTEKLLKLKKKDFNFEIENNFNSIFGKMHLIGKRYSYPMITVYSKKFTSNRFALIGDAAVGMHPVTAHGFNLGLQGITILSKEIKSALKNNIDIGSNFVLNKYQYKMHLAAIPLYFGTNTIVQLYTNTSRPAKIARKFALRAVNTIKPFKRAFMNVLE